MATSSSAQKKLRLDIQVTLGNLNALTQLQNRLNAITGQLGKMQTVAAQAGQAVGAIGEQTNKAAAAATKGSWSFHEMGMAVRGLSRYLWIAVGLGMTLTRVFDAAQRGIDITTNVVKRGYAAFGSFAKTLLETTGSMEILRARALSVFRDMGDGILNFATTAAMQMPFTVDSILNSLIMLRARGMDSILGMQRGLFLASDLAIVFGTDLMHATKAMGQFFKGYSASLSRSYGITPSDVALFGGHVKKGGAGIDIASAPENARENLEALARLIESRYGGATQFLAGTLTQLLTNIVDLWQKFSLAVAQSDILVSVKSLVSLFHDLMLTMMWDQEANGPSAWLKGIINAFSALTRTAAQFASGPLAMVPSVIHQIARGAYTLLGHLLAIASGPVGQRILNLFQSMFVAVAEVVELWFGGAGSGKSVVEDTLGRIIDMIPTMLRGWGASLEASAALLDMWGGIKRAVGYTLAYVLQLWALMEAPGRLLKEGPEGVRRSFALADERARGYMRMGEGERVKSDAYAEIASGMYRAASVIETGAGNRRELRGPFDPRTRPQTMQVPQPGQPGSIIYPTTAVQSFRSNEWVAPENYPEWFMQQDREARERLAGQGAAFGMSAAEPISRALDDGGESIASGIRGAGADAAGNIKSAMAESFSMLGAARDAWAPSMTGGRGLGHWSNQYTASGGVRKVWVPQGNMTPAKVVYPDAVLAAADTARQNALWARANARPRRSTAEMIQQGYLDMKRQQWSAEANIRQYRDQWRVGAPLPGMPTQQEYGRLWGKRIGIGFGVVNPLDAAAGYGIGRWAGETGYALAQSATEDRYYEERIRYEEARLAGALEQQKGYRDWAAREGITINVDARGVADPAAIRSAAEEGALAGVRAAAVAAGR
jgi:hypothetical protein